MISVVIFNWKRPQNVRKIVATLRRQQGVEQIVVWNNGPPEDFGADWQIDSGRNVYAHALPWIWHQCNQQYVAKIDDDLVPTCGRVFLDAVDVLDRRKKKTHHRIVGAFGAILRSGRPYGEAEMLNNQNPWDRAVDLVKGRLMICRKEAVAELPAAFVTRHVDLAASIALAGPRREAHLVAGCFVGKLAELPDNNVGHSTDPLLAQSHWHQRNLIVQEWIKTFPGSL